MKKVIILLSIALVAASCGDQKEKSVDDIVANGNLEELREKRAEIVGKQKLFTEQLSQLDDKIAELDSNKKVQLVTSIVIKESVFNHYVELQGNVSTKNLLVIYPEYAGILKKVMVKEGEKVVKGQQLAVIDDGGLKQQLAQLQIRLDLAKTTYERQKRLNDQKIGSEIQYLQAKSSYEAQEKVVKQLQEQIEKTVVKAPFSGIIDEVITEQGSLVNPGMSPLIRIINLEEMYIETNVPESHITNVTKDKNVEVEFPVLDKVIHAKISQVSNYINPANRTFKIEVPLLNKEKTIKPNLTAKLRINDYTNEKALLIPQSIISENAAGEQYIYVVKSKKQNFGIAKKVIIETGKTQGDVIEVLSGIENGAEIIQEGARSIKDGQDVKF